MLRLLPELAHLVARRGHREELDVVVGGGPECWHWPASPGKVLDGGGCGAEEGRAAARAEEHQPVEALVERRGRLVDGQHHRGPPLARHPPEAPHDVDRPGGVQARQGLIQEEDPGQGQALVRDARALDLAAAEATVNGGADLRVLDLLQAEVLEQLIQVLQLPLPGPLVWQPQERRRQQVLAHFQLIIEDVLLHDVGHLPLPVLPEWPPIQQQLTCPVARGTQRRALGQDVEQRRLAGAAGPHERQDLAAVGEAGSALHDALRGLPRRALEAEVLLAELAEAGGLLILCHEALYTLPLQVQAALCRRGLLSIAASSVTVAGCC
mmetsp:Transcript_118012/g.345618  ORF Transcript_118012/g.345618 Transcript_118012/m.345618 type:complete len:324 (+) Transcript_118012:865-1836(+)